jgi:hypothetical protein
MSRPALSFRRNCLAVRLRGWRDGSTPLVSATDVACLRLTDPEIRGNLSVNLARCEGCANQQDSRVRNLGVAVSFTATNCFGMPAHRVRISAKNGFGMCFGAVTRAASTPFWMQPGTVTALGCHVLHIFAMTAKK